MYPYGTGGLGSMSLSDREDPSKIEPGEAGREDPLHCWFPATQQYRHDSIVVYDRNQIESGAWITSDTFKEVEA